MIVIALVVAAAVWVVMRIQLAKRVAAVPELLPQNDTRCSSRCRIFSGRGRSWHESDLYQIWREPSVQAWLTKPLARLPKGGGGRQTLEDFLRLGPTHGFLALTSLEKQRTEVYRRLSFRCVVRRGAEILRAMGDGFLGENGER